MLYKISNKIEDIKNLLSKLKEEYADYAFISYIDGEYGLRLHMYNSIVINFIKEIRKNNLQIIGICFLGEKIFLENICDHIIEIQDVKFFHTQNEVNPLSNTHKTSNHNSFFVPSHFYNGSDGWNLSYIRGLHDDKYETMLSDINFKNIFYTLHCDGARYINKVNHCYNGELIVGKINNNNVSALMDLNNIINLLNCPKNLSFNLKENNSIIIWIRNTNKWPIRNIPSIYYNTLFTLCIKNKIKCYVIQDFIKIPLPNSEFIIDKKTSLKYFTFNSKN